MPDNAESNNLELHNLLARQQLHDLVCAYSRAVDRLDYALMASVWAPDATVDVGVFTGPADAYSHVITQPNPALVRCSHMITNEWFVVDGNEARGECYVTAATTVNMEGVESHMLVGGRYLDRFVCSDGRWKIQRRLFVQDWSRLQDIHPEAEAAFSDRFSLHGARSPIDPSYNVM